MHGDQDDLRTAMATLMTADAPPVRTDLRDVLRRGRRRLLVRRACAVAGSCGAVAAAWLVLTTGLPLADTDTPVAAPVGVPVWAPAPLPPRSPTATWSPGPTAPPPATWKVLETPLCAIDPDLETADVGAVAVPDAVLAEVARAIEETAPSATVGAVRSVAFDAGPGSSHYHSFDIADERGVGSLEVRAGRFTGTPRERADAEGFLFGDCAPPDRTTLADGTVLQLYGATPSEPFQSIELPLRIYRPDGTVYQLRLLNFGSPDHRLQPGGGAFERTGPGRETLPLTPAQLSAIGMAIAPAL